MAKCGQYGKTILVGELKVGQTRYCSEKCADAALLPAFAAVFDAPPPQTTAIPRRAAALSRSDDALLIDPEEVKFGFAIAIGVSIAIGLAIALHVLEKTTGWQLRGLNYFAVIPVGAVLCGGIITAGYFAASRLLSVRPRLSTYNAPITTAGLLCWLTFFIDYATMKHETDAPLRDSIGFSEFMQVGVENSSIRISHTSRSTVTAGKWG